jgi:hypothetical protein
VNALALGSGAGALLAGDAAPAAVVTLPVLPALGSAWPFALASAFFLALVAAAPATCCLVSGWSAWYSRPYSAMAMSVPAVP